VDAEYFVVNDRRKTEIVKYLRAVPPNINGPVFSEAFIVKPIHLGNLTGLVIASDQRDSVWVSNLHYRVRTCILVRERQISTFSASKSRKVSTL
jgi:hypothetical protein